MTKDLWDGPDGPDISDDLIERIEDIYNISMKLALNVDVPDPASFLHLALESIRLLAELRGCDVEF